MAEPMGVPHFQRLFRGVPEPHAARSPDHVKVPQNQWRDMIRPWDIPMTKGLQDSMHEFEALDHELEIKPVLDQQIRLPMLDLTYDEARAHLPAFAGGSRGRGGPHASPRGPGPQKSPARPIGIA